MLHACGAEAVAIKKPSELDKVSGLIIPGGESTTIGKLMVKYGFVQPIQALAARGVPIYGTCAGLVLLGKRTTDREQPLLGLMDIVVERNAFGRQRESFEADIRIPEMGEEPFPGVFIRAPVIESVGKGVTLMAHVRDKAVMARQGRLLVTAFHPELSADTRIHRYFLDMVKEG